MRQAGGGGGRQAALRGHGAAADGAAQLLPGAQVRARWGACGLAGVWVSWVSERCGLGTGAAPAGIAAILRSGMTVAHLGLAVCKGVETPTVHARDQRALPAPGNTRRSCLSDPYPLAHMQPKRCYRGRGRRYRFAKPNCARPRPTITARLSCFTWLRNP